LDGTAYGKHETYIIEFFSIVAYGRKIEKRKEEKS
jgi:hypothetical protein